MTDCIKMVGGVMGPLMLRHQVFEGGESETGIRIGSNLPNSSTGPGLVMPLFFFFFFFSHMKCSLMRSAPSFHQESVSIHTPFTSGMCISSAISIFFLSWSGVDSFFTLRIPSPQCLWSSLQHCVALQLIKPIQ